MSLSRILNDDPLPPPSLPPIRHSGPPPLPPSPPLLKPLQILSSQAPAHIIAPPPQISPSNSRNSHSFAYEKSYSKPIPLSARLHREKYRGLSPLLNDAHEYEYEDTVYRGRKTDFNPLGNYTDIYVDGPKKRRKRLAEQQPPPPPPPEPEPPVQRRSSRRHTKAKSSLDSLAGNETLSAESLRRKELEERLASSDLEDCEEVWIAELSAYAMETHHRRLRVERWFEDRVVHQNTAMAQRLSQQYTMKMAKIPLRPRTPPPPVVPLIIREENPRWHSEAPSHDLELPPDVEHDEMAEAANDLEESLGMDVTAPRSISARKAKGKGKRRVEGLMSDSGSEEERPLYEKLERSGKRRRVDDDWMSADGGTDTHSVHGSTPKSTSRRDKGKQVQREPSVDSVSVAGTPKSSRKPNWRKKPDARSEALSLLGLGAASTGSASVNVSPSGSRVNSPAPTGGQPTQPLIWELDVVAPPMRRAKKVDDATMSKRVKHLEESQRKVWTNIARREVAKVYKYQVLGYQARQQQSERIAKLCALAVRKPFVKTTKANKDTQAKAKRMMREMQLFWKKNEKEERDVRKREQKEAQDRAKVEEEAREAARQARKLEFLISQSEIYSHFVGSKLKTHELEGEAGAVPVPVGAEEGQVDASTLQEIDFDDEDTTNLHRHANKNAQDVMEAAREKARQFDSETALQKQKAQKAKGTDTNSNDDDAASEAEEAVENGSAKPLVDLDSDELNFQNPTSLVGPLLITQPRMLMAQLKEYQLRGLNWLGTLYEQGINGILADEMGLGKTIQSISLMAYLAEVHDIWGPFLVVAPASTLHNWQQEITRFVPGLKALPYWGNVKDRAVLRKFWSKKSISYDQDAPFHVLITSYQLVTQDQQYFQRVKWQYMILDEAQNIKNANSVRWKTLLGFQCRNRLLLTGTPIQNSMQELWALLHFIMPSLFDNHDEFNEWFSKDIENAAENKGSRLNEHQLRRLHMILKPFMLRRVKRHVQNELGEKIEIDIFVDLSPRQRSLYRALRANVSVIDLLAKARNINDAESARSLMNLVMQFRKVCNHPELFERADVVAPFSFCHFGRSGPLNREGDILDVPFSSQNPITYEAPRLLWTDGGILGLPHEETNLPTHSSIVTKLMNIWSTDYIHKSLYDDQTYSAFSFLRFVDVPPSKAHELHTLPLFNRCLEAVQDSMTSLDKSLYPLDSELSSSPFLLSARPNLLHLEQAKDYPPLRAAATDSWRRSCLSQISMKWYAPPAVAPPISLHCDDRAILEREACATEGGLDSLALYGLPTPLWDSQSSCDAYRRLLPTVPYGGLLNESPADQIPWSYMQVPEAKRLIFDSAKLARLDALLQELKAGDHRVLVYFQMTRMMDLMEEYLIYRQYKYLRLDGSSKLEDRRDMVTDWQTKPEIFIFLLSTRAGGLGINLTAADTVVFYDHDWNPSNDAQAMDRAHRLGQTRQVTVYRLITKGTIDERIVQMARVKKDVQDIVVGSKNFSDSAKPSDIVQLLLNDEQLANLDSSQVGTAPNGKAAIDGPSQSVHVNGEAARDLWHEEGDYFFGHSGTATAVATPGGAGGDGDETPSTTVSKRGKKRKDGAPSTRGRGKGTGARKKRGGGAATGYVDESLALPT